MQSKVLAALFFSTLALAAPAPQGTSDSTVTDGSDSDVGDAAAAAYSNVPSSILTVLETAIPASWYSDFANPASQSSIIADIEAGTMPAWYNKLPASVKAWATSADAFGLTAATPTADSADSADSTGSAAVQTAGASTASGSNGSAAMQTTAASTSSGSTSTAASGSASPSSMAASSTSTGGAPVATGSVAMSLAGAVGLLGLAIAL